MGGIPTPEASRAVVEAARVIERPVRAGISVETLRKVLRLVRPSAPEDQALAIAYRAMHAAYDAAIETLAKEVRELQ